MSSPVLSRRHAAGAESARGLLFTVLGEFVLPGGGSAWTSSIIDVLGRAGVEEKAARQALMRTATDGWLRSERVGRRTRWRLTDAAGTMLSDGAARIYGFAPSADDWDAQWLVVLARVPETDRSARHRLRTRLARAGLGSPAPGVWLSTHPARADAVREILADAGALADAQLFVGTYQGGADLAHLVRQAWDLDSLAEQYAAFLGEFADTAATDVLAAVVELVHAWRRFPWIDPELPRDLLPPGWAAPAAARLFAQRHEQWAPVARARWAEFEGDTPPPSPGPAGVPGSKT